MNDMTGAEDDEAPAKAHCAKCDVGNCADCLWRTRPSSCGHNCPWLIADVQQHFPSLREAP